MTCPALNLNLTCVPELFPVSRAHKTRKVGAATALQALAIPNQASATQGIYYRRQAELQ